MTAAGCGFRVAVLRWSLVGRVGLILLAQPCAGIAVILTNALSIALAHGQFDGMRSLRRRPPVVSLAGTCKEPGRPGLPARRRRAMAWQYLDT